MLTKVIPNTAIVGLASTFVALVFACPLAWLLTRTNLPLANFFMTAMAVVVIVPGFVKAMGWIILVNDRIGLLNRAAASLLGMEAIGVDLNNPFGMAWVTGLMLAPIMLFLIAGSMNALDPVLEEAANVAGANQWRTLMRVSLPLVWPAILGGAIYIFMTAISVFEIPAMLGALGGHVPVLATELFFAVRSTSSDVTYGAAGVYGVLIAVPSMVGLYFYYKLLAKSHRYRVITGKGYRPRVMDLGRYKYLALVYVILYLLLAVGLPLLVLVWTSLLPLLEMPSLEALQKLSFRNYTTFFSTMGAPFMIGNTVTLVVGTSVVVTLISFMTSWIVVRTRLKIRFAMDTVAMLPHAIPGLALAFALFMLGIVLHRWLPGFSLVGTVGIILLANVLSRLAYATRITNAALLQIHSELEECARVCGAANIGIMRRVIYPLIKPSLLFTLLWTALLTFREVSMALMLTETKNTVLSVAVWRVWQIGHTGEASAAVVVMVGVSALLLMGLMVVAGWKKSGEQYKGSLVAHGS